MPALPVPIDGAFRIGTDTELSAPGLGRDTDALCGEHAASAAKQAR